MTAFLADPCSPAGNEAHMFNSLLVGDQLPRRMVFPFNSWLFLLAAARLFACLFTSMTYTVQADNRDETAQKDNESLMSFNSHYQFEPSELLNYFFKAFNLRPFNICQWNPDPNHTDARKETPAPLHGQDQAADVRSLPWQPVQ